MTGPIETAYQALADAVQAALLGASFIPAGALQVDPEASFAPSGDEVVLVTWAALLKIDTKPVQTFLGGPAPRYAVERQARLELAAAGPDSAAVKAALDSAVTACAAIVVNDFQLGGNAERCELTDSQDDDLPPNGAKQFLNFTLRVRALDPLGKT